MRLRDLLNYERVVIQCHNNPDPDALASGFALLKYFRAQGKDAEFVYGGREEISKPNLLLMLEQFHIPVRHVTGLEPPDLLVTVDCQYGESNVQRFEAKEIAVIDHHEVEDTGRLPELSTVMENYGACATVLYQMLIEEDYDLTADEDLQTALFYGLYTDTVRLQELWHPSDKDMWDDLKVNAGVLKQLKNANIDADDLLSVGNALQRCRINTEYHYGFVETVTGDPNILGIVSDTFLEVDAVNVCVAYTYLPGGVKISVRSCLHEIRADEIAKYIAEGIGNAGGHVDKAGGFILGSKLFPREHMDRWEKSNFFETLLDQRMRSYFEETEIIPAGQIMDVTAVDAAGAPLYRRYRKRPVMFGVVELPKHFPAGTKLKVRTLEGDTDVTVTEDTYLMVGTMDEPYPIQAEKFRKKYRLTGEMFRFGGEYEPCIRDYADGKKLQLDGITRQCVTLGSAYIYARPLTKRTHVFTRWNKESYAFGEPGDWFAVMEDDPGDYYIIQDYIFDGTYEPAGTEEGGETS